MEFPVIIIDSISNSLKSSDEEISRLDTVQTEEFKMLERNLLRIHSHPNNDDGDSGIHESSDAIGPSPVPSHKGLTDDESGSCMKIHKSNSASSLVERSFSFTRSYPNSMKNRNFSVDTGRPSNIRFKKSFSPYKLMIVDESGQPVYVQQVTRDSVKSLTNRPKSIQMNNVIIGNGCQNNRDACLNDLCQIHILLIIMKIVLGLSITTFGVYLKNCSTTLSTKDCGFWASSLLLISGILSLYFSSERCYFANRKIHHLYVVSTIATAIISSVICMMSSVYSGIHSNWISFYANECDDNPTRRLNSDIISMMDNESICCFNFPLRKNSHVSSVFAVMESAVANITSLNTCGCFGYLGDMKRLYIGMTCKYLFSSLKDYFVLICSLMAVGSGCEIWFSLYLFKYNCDFKSSIRTETKKSYTDKNSEHLKPDGYNHYADYLPSPLITSVTFPSKMAHSNGI